MIIGGKATGAKPWPFHQAAAEDTNDYTRANRFFGQKAAAGPWYHAPDQSQTHSGAFQFRFTVELPEDSEELAREFHAAAYAFLIHKVNPFLAFVPSAELPPSHRRPAGALRAS